MRKWQQPLSEEAKQELAREFAILRARYADIPKPRPMRRNFWEHR